MSAWEKKKIFGIGRRENEIERKRRRRDISSM